MAGDRRRRDRRRRAVLVRPAGRERHGGRGIGVDRRSGRRGTAAAGPANPARQPSARSVDEVADQTDELGEALVAAGGVGDHRAVERSGATFPHRAVRPDEEVVADVRPALRRDRSGTRRSARITARGSGTTLRRGGVVHEQEPDVLRTHRTPSAGGRRPSRRAGGCRQPGGHRRSATGTARRPAADRRRSIGATRATDAAASVAAAARWRPRSSAARRRARRGASARSHTRVGLYDATRRSAVATAASTTSSAIVPGRRPEGIEHGRTGRRTRRDRHRRRPRHRPRARAEPGPARGQGRRERSRRQRSTAPAATSRPPRRSSNEIIGMGGEAIANGDNVADWEGAQRLINTRDRDVRRPARASSTTPASCATGCSPT